MQDNSYIIVDHAQIDLDKWRKYVDTHPHGTVFHTPYMYDVWLNVRGYEPYAFFALNKNGQIAAIVCGFIQTVSRRVLSILSTRSVQLQSPLFTNIRSLEAVIEAYKCYAKKKKVLYTEVRNHYIDERYNDCMPKLGYVWEGHYNILKEMPNSTEDLWKQIKRKRKDGINKAKKFDFVLSDKIRDDTIDALISLLSVKYRDLGLPIPDRAFFENCLSFDDDCNCQYFHLIDNNVARIVLLSFRYKNTLHAVYIGIDSDKSFMNKRPVDYFYYKLMEYCVENDILIFDWMGAGKPGIPYGVRDFKLQYGGELVDFGRYQFKHRPVLLFVATKAFRMIQSFRRKQH